MDWSKTLKWLADNPSAGPGGDGPGYLLCHRGSRSSRGLAVFRRVLDEPDYKRFHARCFRGHRQKQDIQDEQDKRIWRASNNEDRAASPTVRQV